MALCPECGAVMPSGTSRCDDCGTELPREPSVEEVQRRMEIRGISFDGRPKELVDVDSTELHMLGAARHTRPADAVDVSPYDREMRDIGHRVAQSSVPKDLVKDRHVEILE